MRYGGGLHFEIVIEFHNISNAMVSVRNFKSVQDACDYLELYHAGKVVEWNI